MPTNYRVSFLLGNEKWGWSETWWRSANSLNDLAVPISKYLAFRKRFMGLEHRFDGVRIGVEGLSRNGSVYTTSGPIMPGGQTMILPPVGTMSEATAGNIDPAAVWWSQNRVALQVYTMQGGRRLGTRYFAPIPVLIQGGDKTSIRFDQVGTFWDNWRSFYEYFTGIQQLTGTIITGGGWLIKTVTNTDPAKEKEIISWRLSAGADTDLTFELAAADALPGITTKSKVVIRKARMRFTGMKSPNGTWRVSSVVPAAGATGQLVTIRYSSTIDQSNISAYGLVRIREFSYVQPDDLRIVRIGTHKRGLPFGSTRGRSSTRQFAPL